MPPKQTLQVTDYLEKEEKTLRNSHGSLCSHEHARNTDFHVFDQLIFDHDCKKGQVRTVETDFVNTLVKSFRANKPDILNLHVWFEQGVCVCV